MLYEKTIIAIIPARGGSKGVPRKNIRMVAGKPLIQWTIEQAQGSKYIDRLIVSTEDEGIMSVSQDLNCEVLIRPEELAKDTTPGIDPILHALSKINGYDYVIMLQPTSPLRSTADIDLCIEQCLENELQSCVSVCEVDKSPYWMYQINTSGKMQPILESKDRTARRQDLPNAFVLNGAIYIAETEWLQENKSFLHSDTVAFVMPKERSLDIDTEFDIALIDFILTKK